MKHIKWFLGAAAFALLLSQPTAAANGAREAMAQWYHSVAPSLLPFMALMPLLTCEEALTAYEALLGWGMRTFFALPGSATAALVVALLAGSPAGSHAVRRASARGDMDCGQLRRLALACAGLSPGFLITGIGSTLLGNAAMGHLLLRTQIAVQLTLLFLLRFVIRDDRKVPVSEDRSGKDGSMAASTLAVLSVGGWMALFGAMAGILRNASGGEGTIPLLCVLEVSTGVHWVGAQKADVLWKLVRISWLAGFGGLCVAMQNLAALKDCSVRKGEYLLVRLAAGALSAGVTWVQMNVQPIHSFFAGPQILPAACLGLCAALVPVVLHFKRTEV